MKQNKLMRLQSLLVVMLTMFSMSAMAGSNKDYYSKVTVKAVGDGKVYVSYKTEAQSPEYKTESSAESGKDNQSSAPTHKYYAYAQANEGCEFAGWYDNESCSGDPVSENVKYEVSVKAESVTEAEPTTKNLFAKFIVSGAPILKYGESHAYVNLSAGTYKNESLTTENVVEEITYESSNENVATVAADGTVTAVKNGSCVIKAKSGTGEGTYILTVIDDVAAGVTQIGNGDFEDWRGVTNDNHAPNNWNSFETNEGQYASLARAQQVAMAEGRPGSDGFYCADIYSRSVFGIAAQGNLTTGCINAGATSASHKDNYNYSKTSDPSKSETLAQIPTAIRFWAKFSPAKVNAQHPNAHMEVVVHDAYDYITYSSPSYDTEENKSHVLAKAKKDFPTTNGEWKEFFVPFEWTDKTPEGQIYIIVNLATNADPGQGQDGDHLLIDDVELVYGDEPIVYDKYVSVGFGTPVATPIEVTYKESNTIDFNLKNFILNDGTNDLNVGNVTVAGLDFDNEGKFAFDGVIQIAAGDKEGVDMWMGPALGDIPLTLEGTIKDEYFYVHLNINIPGAPVQVEVGDVANATFKVGESLIGTFCAPFAVALPEEYLQYVSTVTGADEMGVLTLTTVDTPVVPANTPVVVQIPMAIEMPVSGIYVKGTPTVGLLTGVYEDTPAPLGSYVLQNIDDKIGFYYVAQAQPTVKANRCYLTAPAAGVKAFFFNADDATAIESVENAANVETPVYNLAGQRIQKMQKGINIVNGKKVLVK